MFKKIIKWIQDIKMSYSAAEYNTNKVNSYEAKHIAERIFTKYPIEDQHLLVDKISNELKNLQLNQLIIEKNAVKNAADNIKILKNVINAE